MYMHRMDTGVKNVGMCQLWQAKSQIRAEKNLINNL
jgi:hypothetical protein